MYLFRVVATSSQMTMELLSCSKEGIINQTQVGNSLHLSRMTRLSNMIKNRSQSNKMTPREKLMIKVREGARMKEGGEEAVPIEVGSRAKIGEEGRVKTGEENKVMIEEDRVKIDAGEIVMIEEEIHLGEEILMMTEESGSHQRE